MKDGGYLKADNGRESGGVFLVGVRGRLFEIDDDYHAREMLEQYDAVGSGVSVALGSLYSTTGQDPETRIRVALEAAEQFVTSVRAPFHILTAPA
jgi:hypothetical protein